MHPRIIPTVVVTIGLLTLPMRHTAAQTTSKDVAEKASETGEAIKQYTVERKDEAVAHAKQATADLQAKIKQLEAQASKQSGEMKARSQAQIRDLKTKRVKATQQVGALGRAGESLLGNGQSRLRRGLPRIGIGL
jgi:hypothetical protein